MIGAHQPLGQRIARFSLGHHRPEQRHLCAGVGELAFVIEIQDELVALISHRANRKCLCAVINAPRGHYAEDVIFVPLGFPRKHGEKTFAVQPGNRLATGSVDERRRDIHVLHHRVAHRTRLHPARPAHNHRRLQPVIVAGPLGERERVALLAHHHDQRVVAEAMFRQ